MMKLGRALKVIRMAVDLFVRGVVALIGAKGVIDTMIDLIEGVGVVLLQGQGVQIVLLLDWGGLAVVELAVVDLIEG